MYEKTGKRSVAERLRHPVTIQDPTYKVHMCAVTTNGMAMRSCRVDHKQLSVCGVLTPLPTLSCKSLQQQDTRKKLFEQYPTMVTERE